MSGTDEREETATAKARGPDLGKVYDRELAELTPGDFRFKLDMRRKGLATLPLDGAVESFSWRDDPDGEKVSASLSLRRPDPDKPDSLPLGLGHKVRCRTRWAGQWYELWTLRAGQPAWTLEGGGEVEVSDDMALLNANRRKWTFRTTKSRPRGWLCHEIAEAVCEREGVDVGTLAKGTKRIKKMVREKDSAAQMIRAAYKEETDHTARKFVMRMRDGALEVVPYRRNSTLYVIREQIMQALLEVERNATPTTVVEAKGRIGKGKGARSVKHTEFRQAIVDRYGYVAVEKNYGRVGSHAALREEAQKTLAKALSAKRSAELTVPGIPFLRRGDGMRWLTDEPGFTGGTVDLRDRSFVYVTGVTHTVAADYTTQLTVVQEDPFEADRKRLEKAQREKREAARRRRRR